MAKVRCEKVEQGLRSSEALVSIKDFHGRVHFIRIEGDFLTSIAGAKYLPVGIIGEDKKAEAILIELPQEAETGANRLWVRPAQLDELEAVA